MLRWIGRIALVLVLLGLGVRAGVALAEYQAAETAGVSVETLPMVRAGLVWITTEQAAGLHSAIESLRLENGKLEKALELLKIKSGCV